MDIKSRIKKRIRIGGIVLSILLLALLTAFGIHCHSINKYNSHKRSFNYIYSGGSDPAVAKAVKNADNVNADIHQRGQATDTWVKNDESLGAPLNGIIYELSVTNGSATVLNDWSLRLNITEPCYINNAWCGTVEIHQNKDSKENVQLLDLRNCDREKLTLDYIISGNDILIPLNAGDYIIYSPSEKDGEKPIKPVKKTAETVNSGFIFYSSKAEVDFGDYTLDYYLNKSYIAGTAARIYLIFAVLWIILTLVFIIISILIFNYERRLETQDKIIRESLAVFSSFVDAKDTYTLGHSRRVAHYSRAIAKGLGFSKERCRQVYYVALLHDIGKCYVPDEILKKPSRLTDEEFEIIKTHSAKGAEMVKGLSSVPDIYDGVMYHHERYDGGGYPTGKKGKDIPLIGRIICVADSYDAMSSNRVYRSKLSKEEIEEELRRNSGTQFDPEIVEVFLKFLNKKESK